jgi:hypothetical protein
MADTIELSPWQDQVEHAVQRGARYVLIKAGRKSGKTKYIEYRMVKNGVLEPMVPDQVNAYIAPSRMQAKNILWRRLKLALPRNAMSQKPRESDLIIDMKSGIRNQLFGAENEDAIRGLTFGPTILDEADFMRAGFYEEIVEPNLAVTKAPVLMASTPKNRWFTKLWRAAFDGRMGREWAAFHFTIMDNPHISRSEIDSIKGKVSKEIWEQEYLANENAYCGTQYSEFENAHIVQHRDPKSSTIVARALDWGWEHPSHCLWGEVWFNDQTGRWNLYIYRELQLRGLNIESLVTPILAFDTNRTFLFNVIDGSSRRTEMASGESILKQFFKFGLPCRVPYGTPDFMINAAKMMLRNNDVQISENCPILIKQLREVEWGDKYGDDAADAFKYFCSMVYERDFAHIERGAYDLQPQAPIDPHGLLAAREPDTMEWTYTGY